MEAVFTCSITLVIPGEETMVYGQISAAKSLYLHK